MAEISSWSVPEAGRAGGFRSSIVLPRLSRSGVEREDKCVDERRLAAAGDDDPLAGMGPQVGGHLANPPWVELEHGLERRQGLAQGRLGTSRRRDHLLTRNKLSGQGRVYSTTWLRRQTEPVIGHPSRDRELALDHVEPVHGRLDCHR